MSKHTPPRFYVRSAGPGTNSYNVYDRLAYHPSNSTGHRCVEVMLTREQADYCASCLNAEEKAKAGAL